MKKEMAIVRGMGLLMLFILAFAFGSIAQAQAQTTGPSISVSPSTIEVSQGDTFTVDITIDPAGREIYGAQYYLFFNPEVLRAVSQTQGSFLAEAGVTTTVIKNVLNNTTGEIVYGEALMGAEHGATEPGVLASISFKVVGASGTSVLELSNVILSDSEAEPIETTIKSGTCTIVSGAPAPSPAPAYTDISAEDAHRMLEENPAQITLLDVRTEEEYNAEHISEAKHIPLSELGTRIGELDRSKKIIVYCQSGGRSREASEMLAQHGFVVYNMLGGINAWRLLYPRLLVKPTTPTPAHPITPPPLSSPSPATSPITSPIASPVTSPGASPTFSPAASPSPEEERRIPGFEVVLTIAALFGITTIMWKRRVKIKE